MAALENEQYERFCKEYLIDLSGPGAYKRSGFSQNAGTARVGAFRLLSNVSVQKRIQELIGERAERTGVAMDMVVHELARIGFADLSDFVKWGKDGPVLVESSDLDPDQTAAVLEVSETETKDGGSRKIKLHDKLRALELLGKHLGGFVERVDHTSGGKPINAVTFRIIRDRADGAGADTGGDDAAH